jgi:Uma2 family endonuclease
VSTSPTSAETTALLLESPRRLSVAEYHRMIETGILDEDERLELLEGVIVAMSPQDEGHAWPIQRLTRILTKALGDRYDVRVQLPLSLDASNEPEPDLAVVRAGPRTKGHHPKTAVLVIEVADDSLRRDRSLKAALYARHKIPEYWIVNVAAESVEVFTEPRPRKGAYHRTRTVAKRETLVSETLPQVSFAVRDLFS